MFSGRHSLPRRRPCRGRGRGRLREGVLAGAGRAVRGRLCSVGRHRFTIYFLKNKNIWRYMFSTFHLDYLRRSPMNRSEMLESRETSQRRRISATKIAVEGARCISRKCCFCFFYKKKAFCYFFRATLHVSEDGFKGGRSETPTAADIRARFTLYLSWAKKAFF